MSSRRSFVAAAAGLTVAGIGIALPARSADQMYPQTHLHGIDVGGMTRSEAEVALRNALAPLEIRAATFTFEDQRWDASLADLGMSIDVASMIDSAYAQGRSNNPFARFASLAHQGENTNTPLVVVTNQTVLDRFLETINNQISIEPANALLVRRGTGVEIREEKIGRKIDLESARQATSEAVSTGTAHDIPVPTLDVQPNLYASQLESARDEATLLIADPVVFTHGDVSYDFDSNELAGALVIGDDGSASLDLEKLSERMQEIANDATIPPINVKLGWDSGLYVVEDDVDGVGVDMEEFGNLILETTRNRDDRTVELPMMTVRASARTDNIDDLGITDHISYGSSLYTGSNETRAANVVVSANNISYKIVGPGETFSFSDQMGEISVENGFVEGKIISGDWTASDLGGGVCQVSTTVFRAAFYAGFRFSEWNHHGWRLPFYETDGSPPGLDAAIYQPNSVYESEKDLKFINALDSWLLLMMVLDGETVTAHLYGRPNGWTVEVGDAQVSDPIEPGEPVYRLNDELRSGQRQMVKTAQDGFDVSIHRTVTDADGEVVSDGDFVSTYRAQPEIWEVGPNTQGVTITPSEEDD
ncbi:MAG TPA: VanW family protein [Thermomicrobiales bacterium]|nr:VanW family protein [Thermomicrobiales bacterium]